MKRPTEPTHVIGICGGAVAGSESARMFAEGGAIAIVLEQGARPYGKIEDGLPRWHVRLREKEYARIDANLSTPGVFYVPQTRLGRDVALSKLSEEMGLTAVILATGAWRDRPLPIDGVDRFVGRGLLYQNPFIHWFNHHQEPGYSGPHIDVPDGSIVVGGGLASIDVVKIISMELYRRALGRRGIEVDAVALEHAGIPATLEEHGLTPEELGVEGCTLYYRRRIQDMPLAAAKGNDPAQIAKIEAARVRILDKVMRKFLVRVSDCSVPISAIEEGDRMCGLVFRKTQVVDGRLEEVPDSDFEVRSPLVISSIGSLPLPIPGVPSRGDLYDFDPQSGAVVGATGVFGLGNVLTGKGNIRDSRANANVVAERIIENLLNVPDVSHSLADMSDALHEEFRSRAAPLVEHALGQPKLAPEQIAPILDWVERRWREVGYGGDYGEWIAAHQPGSDA